MKRQLTVAALALFLMVAGASAHEVEVMYDRREPVELAVHYQKMTTVEFWDVVANVSTTIPATVLDIRKDPMCEICSELASPLPCRQRISRL